MPLEVRLPRKDIKVGAWSVDHVFWDCPATATAQANMLSPALRAARAAAPVAAFRCVLIPNTPWWTTKRATALHSYLSRAARLAAATTPLLASARPRALSSTPRPLGPRCPWPPRHCAPRHTTLRRCRPLSAFRGPAHQGGAMTAEVSARGGPGQVRDGNHEEKAS